MVAGLEYHPDFVSARECAQLLDAIAAMPLVQAQYKQFTARRRVAADHPVRRPIVRGYRQSLRGRDLNEGPAVHNSTQTIVAPVTEIIPELNAMRAALFHAARD